MGQKLELTLAMGDYEIVRALKEGTVEPDGIKLNILTKMDSTTRHWRFLRNQDFDVAECSCSSYLVARDQGMPFDGIPVFLHRRFRHGFMFINTTKGVKSPKDLIGCKMGVKQFQSSAQLWMRGILEHEYGVPHRSIEWFSELDESIEFEPPKNLKLTRLPNDKSVESMLAEGELDAVLHPDLIKPLVDKDPRVGRLFPNFKEEEISYFTRTRIFPIMHVLGIKREIVEKHPWVPLNLFHAFNEAKDLAMRRMVNPRIVPLAWYRESWEEQESLLGSDPWQYGMTLDNENQLTKLVGYSYEQGMIRREIPLEELFLPMSQGRKRGHVFRV
ncbi:MAG: 4,5-dihydroxyphthalate decarboxylase [Rhodospirillaceae bacterium]|nr:4,5-dihydroxyphthalate decarboxylase [Rhodospirillaceae bacterium]|tara:strand:- start:98 stop:1087 length:990 start_codon:yes stop_codon:yes gene_type:complete